MVQYFCLKKECCIYFNSNGQNRTDKKNMNFTSINFLNNEAIINYNINIDKGEKIINNDYTPGNSEMKLNNKDNNMSKSQYRDIIENQINYNVNGYYAISPLELNNIKESSNNNFNLLSNNNSNRNEIGKIIINDKLDFDISPLKKNESQLKKDSLIDNLNNLDSIDEINNINNKNSDSLKYEKMAEREEDKKRGKVMDRIVKGRARLNDNKQNKNDLKSSNIIEKSKLHEKILGNSNKNEELENTKNINNNEES